MFDLGYEVDLKLGCVVFLIVRDVEFNRMMGLGVVKVVGRSIV